MSSAQVGEKRKLSDRDSDEEVLYDIGEQASKKLKAIDEESNQEEEQRSIDQEQKIPEEGEEEIDEDEAQIEDLMDDQDEEDNEDEDEENLLDLDIKKEDYDDDGEISQKIGDQIVFINLEENKHQNSSKPVEVDDILLFDDQVEKTIDHSESITNKQDDEQSVAPWASSMTLKIKSPLIRLHNEIIELSEYLSPTKSEHQIRAQSLEKQRKNK